VIFLPLFIHPVTLYIKGESDAKNMPLAGNYSRRFNAFLTAAQKDLAILNHKYGPLPVSV